MDGAADNIEDRRQALMRILAGLVAMAGLVSAVILRVRRTARPVACPESRRRASKTIQRSLRNAVLRLLRPAESAARRLVVALAGGIAETFAFRHARAEKTAAQAAAVHAGDAARRGQKAAPAAKDPAAARSAAPQSPARAGCGAQRHAAYRPWPAPKNPGAAVAARSPRRDAALPAARGARRRARRPEKTGAALCALAGAAALLASARQDDRARRCAGRCVLAGRRARCVGPRHEVHDVLDFSHALALETQRQRPDTS